MKNLLITNCRLFNSSGKRDTVSLLIEKGSIKQIGKIKKNACYSDILDGNGKIIAPGFIDVHIQGAGSADVLDSTAESLETISKTCARFGTTSFLATTVFHTKGNNSHLKLAAENVGKDLGGANLLGIHIEGPFISLGKKGMISPECICPVSSRILKEIKTLTKGVLKMMTIAPELQNSLNIIRNLKKSGIIASFGHSSASYEETILGIRAGISHVTHLFNAMLSIHHRNPGPIPAFINSKNVTAQIIPDGVHLHKDILKLAFGLLCADRCIVITDGLQAMGLPDGEYTYNGKYLYEAKNGTARYKKNGALIGTTLGLNQLLIRLMKFTGCSLETAVKTVTENPAKLLGIEKKKGNIEAGKDADHQ